MPINVVVALLIYVAASALVLVPLARSMFKDKLRKKWSPPASCRPGLKLDDPDRACLCAKGFCAVNGTIRTLLAAHTQVEPTWLSLVRLDR